eukprot:scaffold7082_cov267-Chaetoceros_neogracile.AAC.2
MFSVHCPTFRKIYHTQPLTDRPVYWRPIAAIIKYEERSFADNKSMITSCLGHNSSLQLYSLALFRVPNLRT